VTSLTVTPVDAECWQDFVDLFERRGPRGGYRNVPAYGCWCMFWRDRSLEHGTPKKRAMGTLVRAGTEPGLLAYDGGRAVAWISVAPRESYGQLVRSRTYAPPDDDPGVWSIVCLYVHASERRRKLARVLLERAIAFAFERGATAIEAYPASVVKRSDYMGSLPGYEKLGFVPVREAGTRTVVRLSR
jgi:GNAT superfamily N-acetyltransferase